MKCLVPGKMKDVKLVIELGSNLPDFHMCCVGKGLFSIIPSFLGLGKGMYATPLSRV
jgi:hypothetical protein